MLTAAGIVISRLIWSEPSAIRVISRSSSSHSLGLSDQTVTSASAQLKVDYAAYIAGRT